MRGYHRCLLAVLTSLALLSPGSHAADQRLMLADLKAHEVRDLKESGRIMSLEELLRMIRTDYPGRVIEVELEKENGRYVYEIEIVDEKGVVWEIELDASNGQLLKRELDD